MNQRLQQFLAAENISQAQFADTIDVARASVSHVLAGRNKPGYDFIKSISEHYPKLNLEWLISGKGKMYKQDAAPASVSAPVTVQSSAPIQEAEDDLFSGGLFGPEQPEKSGQTERGGQSGRNGQAYGAERSSERAENASTSGRTPQNNPGTVEIKTLAKSLQNPTNQRSITKIIVFFDDNSFQEIQ